jgi:hypothetical protein
MNVKVFQASITTRVGSPTVLYPEPLGIAGVGAIDGALTA